MRKSTTKYVIYSRDESGILTRQHHVRLAAVNAAEYVHPEPLRGWPETRVMWQRKTGVSLGIARA